MAKSKSTTPRKTKTTPPKAKLLTESSWAQSGKNLSRLESQICDLERWGQIAFMMAAHDLDHPESKECLGFMIVEHIEKLTAELRAAFYKALEAEADHD